MSGNHDDFSDDSSDDTSSDDEMYLEKMKIDDSIIALNEGKVWYDGTLLSSDDVKLLGFKLNKSDGLFDVVYVNQAIYLTQQGQAYGRKLVDHLTDKELKKFKAALLVTIATQSQIRWPTLLGYEKTEQSVESYLGLFKHKEMRGWIQPSALFYVLNQGTRSGKQHGREEKLTKSLVRLYDILEKQKEIQDELKARNKQYKASPSNEKK